MADFDLAFAFMAPHEWNQARNYTNNPADPGGPTKYGISLRTWQEMGSLGDLNHDGKVDAEDILELDEARARYFYSTRFWIWGDIADDRLAAKLFDMGVNMGKGEAVLFLQKALCALGSPVVCDGKLGNQTIQAANAARADKILSLLVAQQKGHYEDWISEDPRRQQFRAGLMTRAASLPPQPAANAASA